MITQHRAPHTDGVLAGLLGRHTKLSVREPAQDDTLQAGTVYLAPPDPHVVVERLRLRLSDGPRVHYPRPSIDVLFRSAAVSWGPRTIGVVLSGTGSDGADALRAIRDAGGTVIVQDPRGAKFPALPRSAIAANHIHFTPAIGAIGPLLAELVSSVPLAPSGLSTRSPGDRRGRAQ